MKTNTGVPQGDGLSANEFTFYLAKALKVDMKTSDEHSYALPSRHPTMPSEHSYAKQVKDEFTVNLQYADDISIATTNPLTIDYVKNTIPAKLKESHLNLNKSKTEYYEIRRNGRTDWKSCKLLGSLLDTKSDINR